MPDAGELIMLLVLGGIAAAVVATPFVRRRRAATRRTASAGEAEAASAVSPEELEVLLIRHRVALEAVRDVEADRRAGSLDDAAYAEQRELAERRAEQTLAELDAARAASPATAQGAGVGAGTGKGDAGARHAAGGGRPVPGRWVAIGGGVLVVAVAVGLVLPAPFSLADPVRFNQPLADQLKQEADRQATIKEELAKLSQDPTNTDALSKLADAYLAGGSSSDAAAGAQVLLALISLEPKNTSAFQRLITAYVEVGDWTDASAATDSYASIAPGSPDIPFFRGVIALQGTHDNTTAIKEFNAFLAAAPDDPRVTMVRNLLQQAQDATPQPSSSP